MIELPQIPVQPPDETGCQHSPHLPTFDEMAAQGLSTEEIRKKWPRYFGPCMLCGETVIIYASFAHYVYGDW